MGRGGSLPERQRQQYIDGGRALWRRNGETVLGRVGSYTDDMSEELPEEFDLEEPRRAIAQAEVLVVGFGWLVERLLVDVRSSASAGPYVRVVDPVRSPQERIRELRELRPGFNDPEAFIFFPWPGRVEAFVEAGLFEQIADRCRHDEQARADCATALETLLELDRDDLRQAILGGEKYHTVYDRHSAGA